MINWKLGFLANLHTCTLAHNTHDRIDELIFVLSPSSLSSYRFYLHMMIAPTNGIPTT